MHNDNERTLPLCIYPIKYLYEPLLPYDSLLDNKHYSFTIYLININLFLIKYFSPKIKTFLPTYTMYEKRQKIFMLISKLRDDFLDIL